MLGTHERLQKLLNANEEQLKRIDDILLGKDVQIVDKSKEVDTRTVTQEDAARRLGVSWATVHRMIKQGKLKTCVLNKNKRVLLASVIEHGLEMAS